MLLKRTASAVQQRRPCPAPCALCMSVSSPTRQPAHVGANAAAHAQNVVVSCSLDGRIKVWQRMEAATPGAVLDASPVYVHPPEEPGHPVRTSYAFLCAFRRLPLWIVAASCHCACGQEGPGSCAG